MKLHRMTSLCRLRGAWLGYSVSLIFLVLSAFTASSQTPTWSGSDSYQAWVGYNGDFYAAGANGGQIFTEESVHVGGSSWSSFWEEAEEIEVAEDAYRDQRELPLTGSHAFKVAVRPHQIVTVRIVEK